MARGDYRLGDAAADVMQSVGQEFSRYHALPPLKKNRFRAGVGSALIFLGLYSAAGRPSEVFGNMGALAACAAAIGFGALWLYVGINGARGPRDVMSAFWSLVALVVFGALAVVGISVGAFKGNDGAFYLEGALIAGLVGSAMRLWLAVCGMPTGGLEQVKAQQAHGKARDATPAEAAAKLSENDAPRPARQFRD